MQIVYLVGLITALSLFLLSLLAGSFASLLFACTLAGSFEAWKQSR